ncbi:MAG TPA: GNAT family protein [bacterium]|nr:GNAT family protein [bacterium]
MNILGKKVVLRAIEPADLTRLNAWANDPELAHLEGSWHFPSSMEFHKRWLEALQEDRLNQRFAISAPDLGLIGLASLMSIDWKNGHAHQGTVLGAKDARDKGYGTDTVMAIMRYAFEELRLERLETFMIEYNAVSLHVYCQKCGWKEEGRRKRRYFQIGRYWDQVLIGITREDYLALIAENKYWDTP